jgi:penicillin-binding protein 1A
MRSANAATVRISRSVGEANVVQAARRNGIHSPLEPVPSIALGALEVTPLELVAAYAPFANGGFRVEPRLVRSIEAADGTVLWTSSVERTPAMDPRDAYQVTSMLRSVVDRGTGRPIRDHGVRGPVAGKTGTTNDGADVWFVGYTPTLVAGFWFGHDEPRSIGSEASGGRLAAPAWADFYTNGWKETGTENAWRAPPGLVMRVIDGHNGELANEWCPLKQEEWFRDGTEPVRRCDEHTEPVYDPEWDIVPDSGDTNAIDKFGQKVGRTLKKIFKF